MEGLASRKTAGPLEEGTLRADITDRSYYNRTRKDTTEHPQGRPQQNRNKFTQDHNKTGRTYVSSVDNKTAVVVIIVVVSFASTR